MNMLSNLIVVIISQYTYIKLSCCTLEIYIILFANCTSVNLGKM